MKVKIAFNASNTDKGYMHGYDQYYEKIFQNFVPESILEIGVQKARSLFAWRLLFPRCRIHGIDITKKHNSPNIEKLTDAKIFIHDSTKNDIVKIIDSSYDIIIDDGSHYYKDQIRTFRNLQNSFKKYYVIEDYMWDPDAAVKFLGKIGYTNVNYFPSLKSRINIRKDAITKNSRATSTEIVIDQWMIVIEKD